MDFEDTYIPASEEFSPFETFDVHEVETRDFSDWGVPRVLRQDPATADAVDARTLKERKAEERADLLDIWDLGQEIHEARKMDATDDSSIEEVDMLSALDNPRATASVFKTSTGGGLFYKGMSNAIYGKGGDGKSLLAAVAAVETLLDGGRVLWIDYEQDASGVGHRLLDVELNGQQIERSQLGPEQFSYRRPELPLSGPKWDEILEETWDLVIIDSINQALGSHIAGGDAKEGKHVNQWDREIRQPLTRTGACVLTIDHIPKNSEVPTPYGAQEKTATLSGSSVFVKPFTATSKPAKGQFGQLELIVQKDRHGGIGTDGSGTKGLTGTAAVVDIDSTGSDSKIRVSIRSYEAFTKSPERIQNDVEDFVLGLYRTAYEQGETLTSRVLESKEVRGNWPLMEVRAARDRLTGDKKPLRVSGEGRRRSWSYSPTGHVQGEFTVLDDGEPLL